MKIILLFILTFGISFAVYKKTHVPGLAVEQNGRFYG